ncbi:uncharacterized protein P884DRAFT_69756 [Thermothelomyces heterothallicus CBS 202.75]|uniref:uncharacterized protein n=1 Tax=Thermothelomyces heterothallicus CBS 202.75 TaxID=1149848 RepID=UPI003743F2EC
MLPGYLPTHKHTASNTIFTMPRAHSLGNHRATCCTVLTTAAYMPRETATHPSGSPCCRALLAWESSSAGSFVPPPPPGFSAFSLYFSN